MSSASLASIDWLGLRRLPNREALSALLQVWGQAAALADQAFGTLMPLPRVGESISVE